MKIQEEIPGIRKLDKSLDKLLTNVSDNFTKNVMLA